MDHLAPTSDSAPSAPSFAPSVAPAGAGDAQAKINAIYADRSHPFHKGDKAATQMVHGLFQQLHGDAPAPDGPQLREDPAEALRGPEEVAVLRDIAAGCDAAGIPRDYAQAAVDAFLGVRPTLPPAPPGYVPPTAAGTRAALAALEGPAQAQQTIAKAEAVYAALTRISPEVADRMRYALGESGIGRAPGTVQQFAKFYDMAPESQKHLVMAYFGPQAVETLFGPEPRR